jgi:hypothetical protein
LAAPTRRAEQHRHVSLLPAFHVSTRRSGAAGAIRRAYLAFRLYTVDMATHGICRVMNGWIQDDTVWILHDDGKKLEIKASQYEKEGYQPPIKELPECKGQQNA